MTAGPGQTMFAFVRHWSRRLLVENDATADRGRLVLVVEAVHALGELGRPVTVNAVARELGLDQSGASRLLGRASEAGYLTLAASPYDRRRREASLTEAGLSVLDAAHRWQERVFDELTAGWSPQRRRDVEQAMRDLIASSQALDL